MLVNILILVVLIIISAYFSASETALLALSKIRIKHLEEQGSKEAKRVAKLLDQPKKLLSSILVGNNLVNIAASAMATSLAIAYFGDAGIGYATLAMTVTILIFGEITPKSIAMKNAESIALKVTPILSVLVWVFAPVTFVLNQLTKAIMQLLGDNHKDDSPFVTEEELKMMISIGHEEGILEKEEKNMLHRVFNFGDLLVKEVMIPRYEMAMVGNNVSFNEIKKLYKKKRYSRVPVYDGTPDHIIGVLFMKDVWANDVPLEAFKVTDHLREPFYVQANELVAKVFLEMKRKRIYLAVVLDEYGGTAGIITLEDMLEEIVGEIYDEYEEPEKIKKENDGSYVFKGNLRLRDLEEALGIDVEEGEYETTAGFIIAHLGRLPKTGEKFKYKHKQWIVEHADKKKIHMIRLRDEPDPKTIQKS